MGQDLFNARKLIESCQKTKNPYLDLGYCGIDDLRDLPELFECIHLETLILSENWWELSLGRTISQSQKKSKNHGEPNKLSFIPLQIENLENLQKFVYQGNERALTKINFLKKLTKIKCLYLPNNNILDIKILEHLVDLESLDLWNNDIDSFSSLSKLRSLKSLSLGGFNSFLDTSVFKDLTNLKYLELLRIKIDNTHFLTKLVNLQYLNLYDNSLTDCKFVINLKKLKLLNLTNNQLDDIKPLQNSKNLVSLDLTENQISDISPLKDLVKLRRLVLRSNRIKDIIYLDSLKNLEHLTLQENNIKEIPLNIFKLNIDINFEKQITLYEGLSIGGNPIESPPIEIIKQGYESIFDWFEATKKKLDEIKVILLGDPKAGKTSLLRRLKDDKFDKDEVQTDGINIEHINFGACNSFKHQRSLHNLTAHFWDFGGQEIMNATHQFFLTNRCIYILVLDARKDANVAMQIRQWVKRIKATGGDSPIIVIANQVDINQGFGFSNEFELQQEFPQIKYFIKASCDTGEGIDLLKQKLEELIPIAELFNTEIDEKWIKIKENLQEETESLHFLDETRFIEICANNGLTDKVGRKNAITFLHDLGLVLHFENLDLAEYYVLDPYWITYGVYQIVTSGYVGKQKGIVTMDKLEYIVNEEEDKKEVYRPAHFIKITYPNPNQRRFLVDILNQFKLCFYLRDHNHFIIPDLLDTSEPLKITEPIRNADDCIRFVYEYEYLPKSIMPYIMVESHQILSKMWRTGCVLENNGCRALVSNYQNRISIVVAGEHKKKREFMAVIRYLIDTINQKMSDKPKMLIPLPGLKNYADYEVLLRREARGRKNYIHDEDKPTEKVFEISELLDGIPGQEEVNEISLKLDQILSRNKEMKYDLELIIEKQEELKIKLDSHFQYLIQQLKGSDINDNLIGAIKELNSQQTIEITDEIMRWISKTFQLFDNEMDSKLKEIYTDLKKSDDVEMKLSLSIPLINLLGINLETKLDVKSWMTKMYQKYQAKIFKLMIPS